MTPVYVTLAIIVGLAGGLILMLAGFFFWHLLQTMKAVRQSIGEFVRVMDPLIKTGALMQLSSSAAGMLQVGKEMVKLMPALNATFSAFNKAFFQKGVAEETPFAEAPADGWATARDSGKHSYTEEDAATRETQDTLRKEGIETVASRIMEPSPGKMTGSQV